MPDYVNEYLGRAVRLVLKPVVRMLIAQEYTYKEFSGIAKEIYVELAIRDFFDKPENYEVSQIASLTGLDEAEVERVLESSARSESYVSDVTLPGKVLSGWHTDPAYTGPYGLPLEIPYRANKLEDPSFEGLVHKLAPDREPQEFLRLLIEAGAVEELSNGSLKVLRRYFVADVLSPELIRRFGEVSRLNLETISANVGGREPVNLFERSVTSDQKLTLDELNNFRTYLNDKGQLFLEDLDVWLSRNTKKKDADSTEPMYPAGLSMIQYIDWKPEEKQPLRELLAETVTKRSGSERSERIEDSKK